MELFLFYFMQVIWHDEKRMIHKINVIDFYLSREGRTGYAATSNWATIHVLKCYNLNCSFDEL